MRNRRPTRGAFLRLALVAVVLLAAAAAGQARATPTEERIEIRKLFPKVVRAVKQKAEIPVLLPATLPWTAGVRTIYLTWIADEHHWSISLAAARGCGDATACFIASFEARGGRELPRPANLRLPSGQLALYTPIRCGASCGPASLSFVVQGTLHTWRFKEPPPGGPKALARLAGAEIAAHPGP